MYSDFAKYGRLLFDQGLNTSHSGNLSISKDHNIYITRNNARVGDLSFEDIVKVNLANAERDKEASIDTSIHRAIYLACPAVHAIVHAHPPHAIVLSMESTSITPFDTEGTHYLPIIPVLAPANLAEIPKLLPALISKHKAVLIRGHGLFTIGNTLEEAIKHTSIAANVTHLLYLQALRIPK